MRILEGYVYAHFMEVGLCICALPYTRIYISQLPYMRIYGSERIWKRHSHMSIYESRHMSIYGSVHMWKPTYEHIQKHIDTTSSSYKHI
jgi:hypothetical protein